MDFFGEDLGNMSAGNEKNIGDNGRNRDIGISEISRVSEITEATAEEHKKYKKNQRYQE